MSLKDRVSYRVLFLIKKVAQGLAVPHRHLLSMLTALFPLRAFFFFIHPVRDRAWTPNSPSPICIDRLCLYFRTLYQKNQLVSVFLTGFTLHNEQLYYDSSALKNCPT
jgi:hypothetical protein